MGRNGMFNGSKQFSSAEDVAVCRCKRWVSHWQIFFPPRHIFHVVDVSPGPWQTLMSRSILSQKLTESLGQMSALILAENNIYSQSCVPPELLHHQHFLLELLPRHHWASGHHSGELHPVKLRPDFMPSSIFHQRIALTVPL